MSVIVVLIGFSIIVAAGFLVAFLWAATSGQYDDDVSPSIRILYDNDKHPVSQPDDNPNQPNINTNSV